MLETTRSSFGVTVDGTSVYVQPGTARMGDAPLHFPGGSIAYNDMISYGGDSSKYQRSMLMLQNVNDVADMTSAVSSLADSTDSLTYPAYPGDSTVIHSVALFTFYSSDGTEAELLSYSKIA